MKISKLLTFGALALLAGLSAPAAAQTAQESETIYIQPLFQYPVAPDSLPTLGEKSDYLVEHFWNGMNFKEKTTVDQNALNDAMSVFVNPMRWARAEVTDKALGALFKNLQKNPVLTLQFTRAAEESLYGPRALFWADNVYLQFVNNLLKTKKVPEARKERYKRHKTLLENSLAGNVAKPFKYTVPTGNPADFYPNGVITVIEFGDPECDDCRLAKLKMETDVTFSDMVDKGQISVMFIIPDPTDGWQSQLTGFSPKWQIGASDEVTDIYDMRLTPCFYVIGREGKILAKNVTYRAAMNKAIEEVRNNDSK